MSVCTICLHQDACQAWVKHGKILYSDFEYDTEDCPHFKNSCELTKVEHGMWIPILEYENKRCSLCKAVFSDSMLGHYCPNCGGKMDG